MEDQEVKQEITNSELFNSKVKNYLLETAKWGKFLAVLGYIGLAILLVLSIFMMFGLSMLEESFGAMSQLNNANSLSLSSMGVMYLVIIVIYFFPVYFMHIFSNRIKTGLLTTNPDDIEMAFKNLKSLFKFMGIVTIVVLSIYLLALLIVIPVFLYFQ